MKALGRFHVSSKADAVATDIVATSTVTAENTNVFLNMFLRFVFKGMIRTHFSYDMCLTPVWLWINRVNNQFSTRKTT
jgi:hypothetical protein